jgi:putative toxin-antitoxin system antitoxin component (TIGR02293 family)
MAKSSLAAATPYDYAALLGIRASNLNELLRAIARGIPFEAIERLQRAIGIDVAALIQVPPRTMRRRKQEGHFTPEESDRLVTAARLISRVLDLFHGDAEAARAWLTEPAVAFGGAAPIEIARTETGAREVENLAARIQDGVFW